MASHFPLTIQAFEAPKEKVDPNQVLPIFIEITPKRLVVSLAESNVAIKYEQNVETKTA